MSKLDRVAFVFVVAHGLFGACSSDSGTKQGTDGSSGTPEAGPSGGAPEGGQGGVMTEAGAVPDAARTDASSDGSTDAATTDAGVRALDQLCLNLEEEMCSWLLRCRHFFGADCGAWWGTQNARAICTEGKAAVAAGHLTVDMPTLTACMSDATDFACEDGIPAVAGLSWATQSASACFGLFRGTVPLGGDCHPYGFATECASGYCKTGASCPGTCTAYVPVEGACDDEARCDPQVGYCRLAKCTAYAGEGEDCREVECAQTGSHCIAVSDTESFCLTLKQPGEKCTYLQECKGGVCVDGKCVTKVASGAECYGDVCPDTDRCINGDSAYSGTCTPHPIAGQPCLNEQCASSASCVSDMCVANPPATPLGKVGENCGEASPSTLPPLSPQRCEPGLLCQPKALDAGHQPTAWECKPPAAAGEPCHRGTQQSCRGSFCDPTTNTCLAPAEVGGTCLSVAVDSCAAGSYCDASKEPDLCVAKVGPGQACTSNAACAGGTCDDASNKCRDLCRTE